MEQAIRIAIEGGWKARKVPDAVISRRLVSVQEFTYGDSPSHGFYMLDAEIREDPEFWRCLGNALEWKGKAHIELELNGVEIKNIIPAWKFFMHRFIDHLAEGKDVESFFSELLKP